MELRVNALENGTRNQPSQQEQNNKQQAVHQSNVLAHSVDKMMTM